MKYKWQYFLAAVFFASYMLVSRGVPLLPVIAGCAIAALITWWKLARQTARWLRAHGQRSVRLSYDVSLFTGPLMAPGWITSYVTTGNVTPITAPEVDQYATHP